MDKLKEVASGLGGNSGGQPAGGNNAAAGGQEDYLDKGLDSVERKYGQGKIDPVKERGMNEKITDTARNEFEKLTGKDVPAKFSN